MSTPPTSPPLPAAVQRMVDEREACPHCKGQDGYTVVHGTYPDCEPEDETCDTCAGTGLVPTARARVVQALVASGWQYAAGEFRIRYANGMHVAVDLLADTAELETGWTGDVYTGEFRTTLFVAAYTDPAALTALLWLIANVEKGSPAHAR